MAACANNTRSRTEIKSEFLSTLFEQGLKENGFVHVGLDLSSRCYQLCFVEEKGAKVNIKLTRGEFEFCMQKASAPLFIAFEGCSGASFWKSYIESLGHKVRLVPTRYTAGARDFKSNKSDAIDADILRDTTYISDFKECNTRSLDELCLRKVYQTLHDIEKSAHAEVNRVRSLFIEIGYEAPIIRTTDDCLNAIETFKKNAEELNRKLNGIPFKLLNNCQQALMHMMVRKNELIKSIIVPICNEDPICCRLLQSIPGINYYLSLLIKINISDIKRFKSARALTAYLGLYPSHTGTGGKIKLCRMSRGGDPILRGAIYEAVLALMHQGKGKKNRSYKPRSEYIESIHDKYHDAFKKAVIKICNKLIRVVYGVLSRGESYNPTINHDLGPCKKNKRLRASESLYKRWRQETKYLQNAMQDDELKSKGFLHAHGIEEHPERQDLDFKALYEFIKHEERVTAHNKQAREMADTKKSERKFSGFIKEVVKNPRVAEDMASTIL